MPVLESALCTRVDYVEAFGFGKGPTTYKTGGIASLEVQNLADEIAEVMSLGAHSHAAE